MLSIYKSIYKSILGLGFLLMMIFSSGVLAGPNNAPVPLPEEALINQRGLSHFKRGYYEMIPRGRKAEAQQEMNRAEQAFIKASEINRDFIDAHHNLARLYYLQGKFEQAEIEYSQVLRLDPGDIDNYVQMAVVKAELGEFQEAIHYLEAAKEQTAEENILRRLDEYIQKLSSVE
jgi:tetratricopeptide (TPR) repeat protein